MQTEGNTLTVASAEGSTPTKGGVGTTHGVGDEAILTQRVLHEDAASLRIDGEEGQRRPITDSAVHDGVLFRQGTRYVREIRHVLHMAFRNVRYTCGIQKCPLYMWHLEMSATHVAFRNVRYTCGI